MRKVEDKVSKMDGDEFQQLDCRKKDTILEWAARYEIQIMSLLPVNFTIENCRYINIEDLLGVC